MGIFPEIMTTTPRYDGSESKTMVCPSPGYYWITARGMDPVGVRWMQQAGMCLACGWTGCSGRSWGWTTSYTPGRTGTHPFGPLPSRRPWGIRYHLSLSLSLSLSFFPSLYFSVFLSPSVSACARTCRVDATWTGSLGESYCQGFST